MDNIIINNAQLLCHTFGPISLETLLHIPPCFFFLCNECSYMVLGVIVQMSTQRQGFETGVQLYESFFSFDIHFLTTTLSAHRLKKMLFMPKNAGKLNIFAFFSITCLILALTLTSTIVVVFNRTTTLKAQEKGISSL